MYNSSPQAGLAALTASPYADSDVMNVQMTPREVAGLQQLAMSYGANEQDLYDPVTGQPRFSFLKKILPMIAGAILPGIPGLGTVAKTIGFGNQALGSALLVGGVTGLVEGDLKKGLMAGLGAYSGAKIGEAFTAAGRLERSKLVIKDIQARGLNQRAEQMFVRLSSNKNPEELLADPDARWLFDQLGKLGIFQDESWR